MRLGRVLISAVPAEPLVLALVLMIAAVLAAVAVLLVMTVTRPYVVLQWRGVIGLRSLVGSS